jgi:hypothetical protein
VNSTRRRSHQNRDETSLADMNNAEFISAHVAKHGGKNMLIHSIPGTSHWLVMSKVAVDRWIPVLLNPMGRARHQFGAISDEEHLRLWTQIVQLEIERRVERMAARDPPS